jgi:iron only hydrogenase large subunit-like protein
MPLKIAIAHTNSNLHKLVQRIKEGKANYHFVEMMSCPSGCIGV